MSTEIEVIKTVALTGEVSGKAIIEAVKDLAGDEYAELIKIIDDKEFVLIGRNSMSPAEDLTISVNSDFSVGHIDPERQYQSVAVVYHEWPGMKHAVRIYPDGIVRHMESFRDDLSQKLN